MRNGELEPTRSGVGIVGLGDMGLPMALNLVRSGFEVWGADLQPDRLARLREGGGTAAGSLTELAEACSVVFLMVVTGAQAKEVALGPGGLLSSLRAGATLILTSTVAASDVVEIAAAASGRGVAVIDAPVTGGNFGAQAGTLTIMAAGASAALEGVRPMLNAVASLVLHVGEEIGMGQSAKAALQIVVGATFASLCEAYALGAQAGVDPGILEQMFLASVVSSPLVKNTSEKILSRSFKDSGARLGAIHKDLDLASALGYRLRVPLFVTGASQQVFQAAIARFPDEDIWAAVKVYEDFTGTVVRRANDVQIPADQTLSETSDVVAG